MGRISTRPILSIPDADKVRALHPPLDSRLRGNDNEKA